MYLGPAYLGPETAVILIILFTAAYLIGRAKQAERKK